ncbi:hypothetical protein [uncultured Devosia sp.]|mgnify:CR=1 FL=1|uniref:hypothetical protein n=1 Tax=uncultured Devosia sp. TaxID=211434 RepID=UPI002634D798|nr:hypothetical protein [uncultured Devosia sp.]
MKKILTLLVASTALTVAIGVPAWSAMHAPTDGVLRSVAALFDDSAQTMSLAQAGDDGDDDNHWQERTSRGHDDDDDCGNFEDDDDDDDDDDCRNGTRNPKPAGTVAPPQNGLFGNGAPPQVQVN